jgi:hypothetical protein
MPKQELRKPVLSTQLSSVLSGWFDDNTCVDKCNYKPLPMDSDDMWTNNRRRLLDRLTPNQFIDLLAGFLVVSGRPSDKGCVHFTVGTACSGTDSPLFVIKDLAGVLAEASSNHPHLVHPFCVDAAVDFVFNCEHNVKKRHWASLEHKAQHSFCDVGDLGYTAAQDSQTNGNKKAASNRVPSCKLFVAGFSCKPHI